MLGMLGIPITRRSLLQSGLVAATGFWLTDRLRRAGPRRAAAPAKAKADHSHLVVGRTVAHRHVRPEARRGKRLLWTTALHGGHERARGGDRGAASAVWPNRPTSSPLIRSTTHGQNGHETAAYMVQTGNQTGGKLVYPHIGAVVSKLKGYEAGYEGLIPPYVVLTEPQGRFSEVGFLGPRYKPFATGGDPESAAVPGGRRGRAGDLGRTAARSARTAHRPQFAGPGLEGIGANGGRAEVLRTKRMT